MLTIFDPKNIPPYTRRSLDAYAQHHQEPGGFLLAVLENNLMLTYKLADNDNVVAIPAIVSYVYNSLPFDCHGSSAAVSKWLADKESEVSSVR